MRSRRSSPDPVASAVRRLRETPVSPSPPDLLDRLVPPAPSRPRRSVLPWSVAGTTLAALAFLTYPKAPPTGTKVLVWKGQPSPIALAMPNPPDAKTGRRATGVGKRPASGHPKATRTVDFSLPPPFSEKPLLRPDDLAYLNARREDASPSGAGRLASNLPPMRDDFVAPPEIQVASNDSPKEIGRLAGEAMARYRQAANVVDARLVRNVSFARKHASMEEFCAELARQTGVPILAGRNVRDENVTIFIKPHPAREVMREIGRTFGFVWEREGEEGEYRYRLKQDTAAQVAEERTRNDDVAVAIGSLTHVVRPPRGAETTADYCRKAFAELLPDELAHLRAGDTVWMGAEAGPGASELDLGITTGLRRTMGGIVHNADGSVSSVGFNVPLPANATPYTEVADAAVSVSFRMKVTEFGGARLDAGVVVNGGGMGVINDVSLGEAKGVAETPPDNARADAALREKAAFARPVVLTPRPTTPIAQQGADPGPLAQNTVASMLAGYRTVAGLKPPRPFMTSDDVWQAVHEATGRDVIADSFSRLFKLTTYRGTLFDALSQACDAMHMRWSEDEGWLVGRSRAYVWQRENEVPKAKLERWAKTQREQGELPLRSILEMSQMSDRQLDSAEVGKTVANEWGLMGWGIPSRPMWTMSIETIRPLCRFLATLPPGELDAMLKHALPAEKLDPTDLARLQRAMRIEIDPKILLGVDYIPAGRYFWSPFFEQGKDAVHTDLIVGNTAEAVEAEVHRRYPERPRGEAKLSDGTLTFVRRFTNGIVPQGDVRYEVGHRAP